MFSLSRFCHILSFFVLLFSCSIRSIEFIFLMIFRILKIHGYFLVFWKGIFRNVHSKFSICHLKWLTFCGLFVSIINIRKRDIKWRLLALAGHNFKYSVTNWLKHFFLMKLGDVRRDHIYESTLMDLSVNQLCRESRNIDSTMYKYLLTALIVMHRALNRPRDS